MTLEEAIKMLKAKRYCMELETSGTEEDCNNRNCDECPFNYDQGNIGEQKEALDLAIKALGSWDKYSDELWKSAYERGKSDAEQPSEDNIRECVIDFDKKHPALFADYMREFNNHPISEIIDYMWDMHCLIEDIKYRLPNEEVQNDE